MLDTVLGREDTHRGTSLLYSRAFTGVEETESKEPKALLPLQTVMSVGAGAAAVRELGYGGSDI